MQIVCTMEVSRRVPSLPVRLERRIKERKRKGKKERKKGSNFRIRTRTIRLSRIVKLYVPLSSILPCRDPRFTASEEEGFLDRGVSRQGYSFSTVEIRGENARKALSRVPSVSVEPLHSTLIPKRSRKGTRS